MSLFLMPCFGIEFILGGCAYTESQRKGANVIKLMDQTLNNFNEVSVLFSKIARKKFFPKLTKFLAPHLSHLWHIYDSFANY